MKELLSLLLIFIMVIIMASAAVGGYIEAHRFGYGIPQEMQVEF